MGILDACRIFQRHCCGCRQRSVSVSSRRISWRLTSPDRLTPSALQILCTCKTKWSPSFQEAARWLNVFCNVRHCASILWRQHHCPWTPPSYPSHLPCARGRHYKEHVDQAYEQALTSTQNSISDHRTQTLACSTRTNAAASPRDRDLKVPSRHSLCSMPRNLKWLWPSGTPNAQRRATVTPSGHDLYLPVSYTGRDGDRIGCACCARGVCLESRVVVGICSCPTELLVP